jgi:hypothetical protein
MPTLKIAEPVVPTQYRAPIRWGRVTGIVVAVGTMMVAGLVAAGWTMPSTPAPTHVVVAEPRLPRHHYVAIVRGYFGYQPALSDNDRSNGIASKPLTLVGYQGKRGNEYTFSVSDGGPYADLIECSEPCDTAQVMGMGGNKVFLVQPGTLLADIIDDARNGALDANINPTR